MADWPTVNAAHCALDTTGARTTTASEADSCVHNNAHAGTWADAPTNNKATKEN